MCIIGYEDDEATPNEPRTLRQALLRSGSTKSVPKNKVIKQALNACAERLGMAGE